MNVRSLHISIHAVPVTGDWIQLQLFIASLDHSGGWLEANCSSISQWTIHCQGNNHIFTLSVICIMPMITILAISIQDEMASNVTMVVE
jgi:hypothetical protein